MKIELTEEQRFKMASVFATLNELRKDKKLMQMMKHCQNNEVDVTDKNEDAVMRLYNFHEDLRDISQYFDFVE